MVQSKKAAPAQPAKARRIPEPKVGEATVDNSLHGLVKRVRLDLITLYAETEHQMQNTLPRLCGGNYKAEDFTSQPAEDFKSFSFDLTFFSHELQKLVVTYNNSLVESGLLPESSREPELQQGVPSVFSDDHSPIAANLCSARDRLDRATHCMKLFNNLATFAIFGTCEDAANCAQAESAEPQHIEVLLLELATLCNEFRQALRGREELFVKIIGSKK